MFNFDYCKKIYNKYQEGILYLIFGFLTTVIYLGVYKVLLDLGVQYVASTNIAFVLAVLFAFLTNRHFVFQKGENIIREILLFYGARIFTQVLNNLGLIMLVELFKMGKFSSQIVMCIVVIILNYFFSKYAIFVRK